MDMMSMYTSEELTEMLGLRKQIEELQARYNAIARKSANPAQAAPFQAPMPLPQPPAPAPVTAAVPFQPQPAPVQYAQPAYTPPPAPAPVAPVMQAPYAMPQSAPTPQPVQQPQTPAQAVKPSAEQMKYGTTPAPGTRPAASPFFKPGVGPIAKPGPKPAKSPIKIPGMKEQAPSAPPTLSSSIYQSIREYAVSILSQSENPLSFDGLFDKMTNAGCPLPSDKPKVIVRKVLCNSPDIFSVTNKGFYTISENYVPEAPAPVAETPVVQPVPQPAFQQQPAQPTQPEYPANPVIPAPTLQPQIQAVPVLPPTHEPVTAHVQPPPQRLPTPVAAQPAPVQPPAATFNSITEPQPPRDTAAKRALTSSGEGSIRERATAAIIGTGRPLSMDEVFDKLKNDGHPMPSHNAKEVIKIILSNKSLFKVVDNGRYQPLSDQP